VGCLAAILELVEVLEEAAELPAEVAFVALELLELEVRQQEALRELGAHPGFGVCFGVIGAEVALDFAGSGVKGEVGAVGLVGGDAVLAPEDERDLFRQVLLSFADGGEAGDDAGAEGGPGLFLLEPEGDGLLGGEAVGDGVERGLCLALRRFGAAFAFAGSCLLNRVLHFHCPLNYQTMFASILAGEEGVGKEVTVLRGCPRALVADLAGGGAGGARCALGWSPAGLEGWEAGRVGCFR
jgi:hypothetical protein